MSESEKRTYSDKFMLRLPDGMRDQLKSLAESNSRSMNAEIVARLEKSINMRGLEHFEPRSVLEMIASMIEMMERENAQLSGQIARIQEKYGPFSADDWSDIEGQNVKPMKKRAQGE